MQAQSRSLTVQTTDTELAGRRVFIVEDESLVAMMLEDLLTDIGCEVAGMAFRYSDALAKAESLAFDIAILDVNLSGEYTFPIAQVVARRGLAVMFSTGYDAMSLPPSMQSTPVIQKPFRQPDLEQALRTALDGRTSSVSGG